ncbi:MAG: hypothetical protein WCI97_03440 [Bacteroidota bacterium]
MKTKKLEELNGLWNECNSRWDEFTIAGKKANVETPKKEDLAAYKSAAKKAFKALNKVHKLTKKISL